MPYLLQSWKQHAQNRRKSTLSNKGWERAEAAAPAPLIITRPTAPNPQTMAQTTMQGTGRGRHDSRHQQLATAVRSRRHVASPAIAAQHSTAQHSTARAQQERKRQQPKNKTTQATLWEEQHTPSQAAPQQQPGSSNPAIAATAADYNGMALGQRSGEEPALKPTLEGHA